MLLEEWIRQMEKIFNVVEVPENRRINIGAFYLTGQADIWWGMVKPTFQNDESTWNKFSEALRAKFYPMHLQKQKQKEFLTLRQGNLSVMEYASRFTELSRFASEFVATDRMKILRFEEGLAPYIRNQLVGQHVQTSQELYELAAEIERVKTELRMANPANPKKRWDDRSMQIGGFPRKKHTPMKPRPQGPAITGKYCTKCGRTNHNTAEC